MLAKINVVKGCVRGIGTHAYVVCSYHGNHKLDNIAAKASKGLKPTNRPTEIRKNVSDVYSVAEVREENAVNGNPRRYPRR